MQGFRTVIELTDQLWGVKHNGTCYELCSTLKGQRGKRGIMARKRTLLAVFAHPDDESFGIGGTLAHYARQGVRVVLVCATNGEAGEIADPSLATRETLAQVRQAELRCAARQLGIAEVIFLGYRDSGMKGSPDNQHPHALINAPAEEVVSRLVGIIRRVRPDVVITFEPNGGYGHPDHMTIHRHTVAAFHAAGDPDRYPEQGAPWQPARLFYTAIPRSVFREIRQRLQEMGVDTRDIEERERAGLGWPDEQVNVVLDVSDSVEAKWRAIHCHRTQLGPKSIFLHIPEDVARTILAREYFALAYPPPAPGERKYDLFENGTVSLG